MKLVTITLFVAFLSVLSFTSAAQQVEVDLLPTPPPPNWPKSSVCLHYAFQGVGALLSRFVRNWKKLVDCVGYKGVASDSHHLYRYLKIVYDFVKLLVTDKIVCGVTHIEDNVKLLKPFIQKFDEAKCLQPPY